MTPIFIILFSIFALGGSLSAGKALRNNKALLLSGLFLGFAAAFATQNENIIRFAWMLGAFGAIGMLSGGNLNTNGSARMVGISEAAIKGFLLFANGAGFASFGIMSIGLVSHTLADTILLFFLLAISPVAGILLFNRGANKLSLSKEKNESWGKNLFIFASLVCIFLVKGNFFSLIVSVTAGLFGTLGQIAPLLFPKRSGCCLYDFTAGALGGIGMTLGFFVANRLFPSVLSSGWFVSSGKLSGYVPQGISLALAALWCALWLLPLFTAYCKKDLVKLWISDFVFCALPFLLLSLGSYHAACLFAIPLCFFTCAESKLKNASHKTLFTVIFGIIWLFASAIVLYLTTSLSQFISLFGSTLIFLSVILSSNKKGTEFLTQKIITAVSAIFSAVLWFFAV